MIHSCNENFVQCTKYVFLNESYRQFEKKNSVCCRYWKSQPQPEWQRRRRRIGRYIWTRLCGRRPIIYDNSVWFNFWSVPLQRRWRRRHKNAFRLVLVSIRFLMPPDSYVTVGANVWSFLWRCPERNESSRAHKKNDTIMQIYITTYYLATGAIWTELENGSKQTVPFPFPVCLRNATALWKLPSSLWFMAN